MHFFSTTWIILKFFYSLEFSNPQKTSIMSLKILPSRKIVVDFEGQTGQHNNALVLDEWTLVVATFSYLKIPILIKGLFFCDLIVGTTLKENAIEKSFGIPNLPTFAVSDEIKIGGSPSFVGELSTLNIYGPGARLPPGMNKKKFPLFLNRILPPSRLSSRSWIRDSSTLSYKTL